MNAPHWGRPPALRRVRLILLLPLLMTVVGPVRGVVAEVTPDDLAALESRLLQRLDGVEANVTQARHEAFSNLTLNVTYLRHALESLRLEANQSQAANLTRLLAELERIGVALEGLRNETLEDHVHLFGALTDEHGQAFLPELVQSQDVLSIRADRLRADAANLSRDHEELNRGNERIFGSADGTNGKATFTNTLLGVLLALQAFDLAQRLQFPSRLWRRVHWEAAKAAARGRDVDPPCPREREGLRLGDYYQCDAAASCKFAVACKQRAIDIAEARAEPEPASLDAAATTTPQPPTMPPAVAPTPAAAATLPVNWAQPALELLEAP